MKGFLIALVIFSSISGCDTSHKVDRNYKAALSGVKSEKEFIAFLNNSYELGPGNRNYVAFVSWGLDHPEKFFAITENTDLTEKSLHLVGYTLGDIGDSDEYCSNLKKYKVGKYEYRIQSLLLGCK